MTAITGWGVPTFRVDFNAPRFAAHGGVQVGDVVRLVDLDPGAGWSYARITSVGAAFSGGIVCHYERAGEFHAWPESYVIVEHQNGSEAQSWPARRGTT